MNEKEYQRFSGLESAQKHDEQSQIFADIARQLTRIADQGEPKIKDGLVTHKIYRDTLEDILLLVRKSDMSIEDRTAFIKRFNETLDKTRPVKPTPSDALVEKGDLDEVMEYFCHVEGTIIDDKDPFHKTMKSFERIYTAHEQDKPLPKTDDALVEAVKVIANSQLTLGALKEYAKSKGIEVDETDTFMSIDRKIAFNALDAHKKAV